MASHSDGERRPWRTAGFVVLLVVLLGGPVLVGFRIAEAGDLEPPEPGEEARLLPAVDPDPEGTDTTQAVSDRALGDAPSSAEDALSRVEGSRIAFARLTLVDANGDRFDLDDEEPIPLQDDLSIAVDLDPFPPTQFHVDVGYRLTRFGEPVTGAVFDTTWDMTFMYHGPFETRLQEMDAGIHRAAYEFFMFGPWRLDTVLSGVTDEPIEFAIEIYVWPN